MEVTLIIRDENLLVVRSEDYVCGPNINYYRCLEPNDGIHLLDYSKWIFLFETWFEISVHIYNKYVKLSVLFSMSLTNICSFYKPFRTSPDFVLFHT